MLSARCAESQAEPIRVLAVAQVVVRGMSPTGSQACGLRLADQLPPGPAPTRSYPQPKHAPRPMARPRLRHTLGTCKTTVTWKRWTPRTWRH
jgi:hypothetical protein